MNSENALLAFYRARLVRREISLIGAYGAQGRSPRIFHLAYWRASFSPLLVPLVFFGSQKLGFGETHAGVTSLCLFAGLILADLQLFVLNAGGWIFAKKTLKRNAVQDLAEAFSVPIDVSQGFVARNQWDKVQVSNKFLQNMAKTYRKMRQAPPTLGQLVLASVEAKSLLISLVLLLAVIGVSPDLIFVVLPVFFFVIAWPAKRLKVAIDFWVTWPVLRQVFDWKKIDELAKGAG